MGKLEDGAGTLQDGVKTDHDRAATESDARQKRMDEVAILYGEITSATRAFLAALAESDRHQDWMDEGFGSCAEWLAWRIGVTRNTANEKVRAARALEDLPLISEAMSRGELSFSKVRAVTRVATPANEAELLEFARAGSAANLERVVRGWKQLSRGDEAQRERARHRTRYLSIVPDNNGMYIVRGRLTPEVGAALKRAVEAASDALFAELCGGATASGMGRGGDTAGDPVTGTVRNPVPDPARDPVTDPAGDPVPDPAQRRADAMGLLAERALAVGFGLGSASAAAAAAAGMATTAHPTPISGSRAERYQVVLHVEAATLTKHEEPGQSELEDGTRVTAETARRLACDASRVEVHHAADGSILDVGRRTRTVPPALRRALESRDRGCRFPGCGLRFTDAHHIEHWGDGGATTLNNLVLLCRRHHRRVHEDGYRVCSDKSGQIVFFTPAGKAFADAASLPRLAADPKRRLVKRNRDRGAAPNSWAAVPRFGCDRDIPWSVEAAAWEALDRDIGGPMEGVT
jgi:uncharacterized protein DUF222/HNH endonuclease